MVDRKAEEGQQSFVSEVLDKVGKEKPIRPRDLAGFCGELKKRLGLETEVSPEVKASLEASQFRAKVGVGGGVLVYDRSKPEGERWIPLPDTGVEASFCQDESAEFEDRTFGVFSLLGEKRFKALVEFANQKGQELNLPALLDKEGKPQENTRGRGILQTAADLLALAAVDFEGEDASEEAQKNVDRINSRMLKWLRREYKNKQGKLEKVNSDFEGIPEPKGTTSSFPPHLLGELLGLLAR